MNEFKLQKLMARHSISCMDDLDFFRRIKAEHLFINMEEALQYLNDVIDEKNPNRDSINPMSFKQNPILVINIIDEAISYIVYDIFQQISFQDQDRLGYYNILLDDFYNKLNNKADHITVDQIEYKFYRQLLIIIARIQQLCDPIMRKEEMYPNALALIYYQLMFCLYSTARPCDFYFDSLAYYYSKKIIWRGDNNG